MDTFFREADGCHLWIDHVVTCHFLHSSVTNVCSVQSGSNLSDHIPILVELQFAVPMQSSFEVGGAGLTRRILWQKASVEQKELYRQQLSARLTKLSCSLIDAIHCHDPRCIIHCKLLDQIGAELTDCLLSCATGVIPMSGERKKLACWHDSAGPAQQRSNSGITGVMTVTPMVVCYFNLQSNAINTKFEDFNADRTT